MKHAFNNVEKGEIGILIKEIRDNYELVIYDDGIGFPDDVDFKNANNLGLKLVNSLVDQINGQITMDRGHGTAFKINFKEMEYQKRI